MHPIVEEYLSSYTQIEKEQFQSKKFLLDVPLHSYKKEADTLIFLEEYFLKNNVIYISKHPRFSPYPEHSHHFLELNYVYSGKSLQSINGHPETIEQGELLLLDKGARHALHTHNEEDILLNIIFPNIAIDSNWLSSLNTKDSILFNFLTQIMIDRSRKGYLIFHCAQNKHVQQILEKMIEEYFIDSLFANEIISLYLPILFTELISNCSYDYHHETKGVSNYQVVIDILKLIETDYSSLTLEVAANKLGYNKNYLSNLIKKKTSRNFSELLMKQRLKQAKFLIENTSLSISQIIERIGLKNHSYFYKEFKKTYHALPSEFR
ncbi:MAG: AraC family transcriptional regulator [Enterococcus sp.]